MQLMKASNTFDEQFREAIWYQNIADSCNVAKPAPFCVPVLGIVAGAPLGEGPNATRSYLHNLTHAIPLLKGIR